MGFIQQLSPYHYRVAEGFVPGMRVPGVFYVNDRLKGLLLEELQAFCQRGEHGGFLPAVKQIANVAALPGIVQVRWRRGAGRRRSRAAAPGNSGCGPPAAEVYRAARRAQRLR